MIGSVLPQVRVRKCDPQMRLRFCNVIHHLTYTSFHMYECLNMHTFLIVYNIFCTTTATCLTLQTGNIRNTNTRKNHEFPSQCHSMYVSASAIRIRGAVTLRRRQTERPPHYISQRHLETHPLHKLRRQKCTQAQPASTTHVRSARNQYDASFLRQLHRKLHCGWLPANAESQTRFRQYAACMHFHLSFGRLWLH
jgi:hypothetical protein